MSTIHTEKTCALCHAILFEEDDVVYCPVCGAPHHRECYNSIGHCALEEAHGTENQYDLLKEKAKKTEKTQAFKPNDFEAEKTLNENYTPGDEIFQQLPPMDFLGGVPADYIFENGITAKEARNFVISNTARYIPKFVKLDKKHKVSWNFMAFLFPHAWLLSRKMYKLGVIISALFITATLMLIPFDNNIANLGLYEMKNVEEVMLFLEENMSQINLVAWFVAFMGSILNFALRFVTAIFGDYWYRQHSLSKIKEIKETSDNIADDFRKYGGVSLVWFMLGLLATTYLPVLIELFI